MRKPLIVFISSFFCFLQTCALQSEQSDAQAFDRFYLFFLLFFSKLPTSKRAPRYASR
jgi:hypothetical protein